MSSAAPQRTQPVAVFDSGVGGLTVLHELLVALPQEDYLYLGDSARFPYGDRDPAQLRAFAVQIADALLQRGAKLLVVACNSATAAALPALQEHLAGRVDVLGVVAPESQLAAETTYSGRVGLLATPATVASGAYERAIRTADPLVRLTSVACPDLAPLIQREAPVTEAMVQTVRAYCRPLRAAGVDTVILGCTHYPLVAPMLQRILGPDVGLISSGQAIARRVRHALAARNLESPRAGEGSYRFLCTGDAAAFGLMGTRFLQLPLGDVAHLDLPSTVEAPA